MLNPSTDPDFTGKIDPPDASRPYGNARDALVENDPSATPLLAKKFNDDWGFDAALMDEAGLTPNGSPDAVGASQRVEAIKKLGVVNADYQFSATPAKFSGWPQLEPAYIGEMKSEKDASIDSDSLTIKNRAIKTWKRPKGIKDGAVAGSFMLNGSSTEPDTQVTGFTSFDDIGTYPGRDAVALYAQNDSAPAIITTGSTVYTATSVTSPDFVSVFDDIDEGMIVDVRFGLPDWKGGVIISKVAPSTLVVDSWRNIDGVSGLAATPTNGLTASVNRHNNIWAANFNALTSNSGGANQAIGIETGLSCAGTGTGTNSKAYYAVNLGGEAPEYAFTVSGVFQKGYTSNNASAYGFQSSSDSQAFRALTTLGDSYLSDTPGGYHFLGRTSGVINAVVTKTGNMHLGTGSEAGTAKLNLRTAGNFATTYSQTELQIFDPTTTPAPNQGFYINHAYTGGVAAAEVTLGVGDTGNHAYSLKLASSGGAWSIGGAGAFAPVTDNLYSLALPSRRSSVVYSATGTINTSDERLKTFRGEFSEAEKAVALKLKNLLTSYYWNDSIEREEAGGKKARVHVGIGAQSLADAFRAEGLDPDDYAMLCYDEWDESVSVIQTNIGEKVTVTKQVEVPVTEIVTKQVPTENIEFIDGRYTLVRGFDVAEVEQPVYDTFPVYNADGTPAIKRVVTKDGESLVPLVHSVQRTVVQEVTEEVEADPVFEEVVASAGSRYGVRLDQVLAFIAKLT